MTLNKLDFLPEVKVNSPNFRALHSINFCLKTRLDDITRGYTKELTNIYFPQWKTFIAEGITSTFKGVVPKFSPSTLMAVGSSVSITRFLNL